MRAVPPITKKARAGPSVGSGLVRCSVLTRNKHSLRDVRWAARGVLAALHTPEGGDLCDAQASARRNGTEFAVTGGSQRRCKVLLLLLLRGQQSPSYAGWPVVYRVDKKFNWCPVAPTDKSVGNLAWP